MYSMPVDKDGMWGGTMPRTRMFVTTYSTQWGWRLLARRGSCHWLVEYEPWRPAAHVCSSDQYLSLPCAARCPSFWALISQHSQYYPRRNTEQLISFQADFRKIQTCSIFPLSYILKIWLRHDPRTRQNTSDFVKSSCCIHRYLSCGYL